MVVFDGEPPAACRIGCFLVTLGAILAASAGFRIAICRVKQFTMKQVAKDVSSRDWRYKRLRPRADPQYYSQHACNPSRCARYITMKECPVYKTIYGKRDKNGEAKRSQDIETSEWNPANARTSFSLRIKLLQVGDKGAARRAAVLCAAEQRTHGEAETVRSRVKL